MRERVCKNCGGRQYKVVGQNMVKCQFCGTLYVDEFSSKEEEVLIVGAYEKLRSLDFIGAVEEFDKILALYPLSFESFYGRALAKNKIVFYNNKRGIGKKPRFFGDEIPELSKDEDFLQAVKNAPPEVVKRYNDQAKRVEKIKKFYEEQQIDKNYDCFVMALQSDRNQPQAELEQTLNALSGENISTYFMPDQKEKEEETFRALQTCKCLLFFVNAQKGWLDGDIKNVYDRYLYAVTQKKKTKSGLVLVLGDVELEELPKELSSCKSVLKMDSSTFLQDVKIKIKKEMEKSFNETAKINTVTIDKVEPQKKEYVNIESINPSELGHYHIDNMELSETNKIKWIFLTLKHGDFSSADELIKKELESDPNNSELLFAKLLCDKKINTQEEFFSNIANFRDKEEIDNILTYASKDFAEGFVDNWEKLIEKMDGEEYYNAFLIYLAKFSSPNRENFIRCAENKAVETMNEELIDKVLKCFDKEEVDRFVNFYFMLAQKSDNQQYYQKILEIDEGHEQSNMAMFLQHFKTEEDKLLFRDKQEVENIFKFFDEQTRTRFVTSVVNIILPVAYNDIENAEKQLDFYLSYVTSDEKLVDILKNIALQFQEMGFFKLAEKYISIAISKDKKQSELYWILVKIKLHCKNDQELIMSNAKLTQMPEWETLLENSNEKEAEKYAEIISKINLYTGERLEFCEDLLDKKQMIARLNEFLDRNNKILLEMEKQEGDKVCKGVNYYKMQMQPFNKYIQDMEKSTEVQQYLDVVSRIDMRMSALDLNLDASINVINLLDKSDGLQPVIVSKEKTQQIHTQKVNNLKRNDFIKKFSFWFLEIFPVAFTTLLLIVIQFMPKEVYLYFNQKFLIVSVMITIAIGVVNLIFYFIKRKKLTKIWQAGTLTLFSLAALNFILFCSGIYIFPKVLEINNAKEMQTLLRNASYSDFKLNADIDLKNVKWSGVKFYGAFDGNGHKILNLQFSDKKVAGFFKSNSGTIKNLEIQLADMTYKNIITFGGVTAVNYGELENISVSGNVTLELDFSSYVGGISGIVEGGEIQNCLSNLSIKVFVKANDVSVGGLIGEARVGKKDVLIKKNTIVSNLHLQANDIDNLFAGGLVGKLGHMNMPDISQNAVTVNIEADGVAGNFVAGGLVGKGYSSSGNNYTVGEIDLSSLTGDGYIGGLYGSYENASRKSVVNHSYSRVTFKNTSSFKVGGLVGFIDGHMNNCYSTVSVPIRGNENSSGDMGNCKALVNKKYDNMFDFSPDIWLLLGEDSYPTLK